MDSLRIAVFGAGAIGVYLAGKLARGGSQVTLIARPASVAQLLAGGLRVIEAGQERHIGGLTICDAKAARKQLYDVLLICTKSQHLLPALADLVPLLAPQTLVVCLQNGIPWWYFHVTRGPRAGQNIRAIDPQGRIAAALPISRVLGCVVYKSVDLLAPGKVEARQAAGDRLVFGVPGDQLPAGLSPLLAAFRSAGIDTTVRPDIRPDIWDKLLGNASFNPLSALSRALMRDIIDFPPTCQLVLALMREITGIANAYGIALPQTPEQRLERARAVGAVRTSMLQDTLNGRSLETEGILGSLLELAEQAALSTPHLSTLYAATALLSKQLTENVPARSFSFTPRE